MPNRTQVISGSATRPVALSGVRNHGPDGPDEFEFSIANQLDQIQSRIADLTESASASTRGGDGTSEEMLAELQQSLAEQREQISTLAEQFTASLRTVSDELKANHEAAVASQGDLLRTLTATMIQSAAGDPSSELAERIESLELNLRQAIREALQQSHPAKPSADVPVAEEPKKPAAEKPAPKAAQEPASQSWEQIRAAFMNGDAGDAQPEIPVGEVSTDTADLPIEVTPVVLQPEADIDHISELSDIDAMSADELRSALIERDQLVSTLIGRVRRLKDQNSDALSPEQLKSLETQLPQELQQRVEATLKRMDEQIRMGELEMSLERARLARHKSQLEQSQQSLDRQARQMGLVRNEDGTYNIDRSDPNKKQPRRWLGRLGIGE